MARKKLSRAEKMRNYFRKHPDANVKNVSERFGAHVSEVYKMRTQVRQAEETPVSPARKPQRKKLVTVVPVASKVLEWEQLKVDINTLKTIGLPRVKELLALIDKVQE